jgi:hypothetical protein
LTYAAAHTYYVTQSGTGYRTGKSLANAWSVSDFNSSTNWSSTDNTKKIDPGDTVYFSGTFSTQVDLPQGVGGSAGKYVTLDGWEGGTCNPVANHDAICDPDVSGEGCNDDTDLNACPAAAIIDLNSTKLRGINFQTNNYIIVQDFEITNTRFGIVIDGAAVGCDHIIIRRNYIHDNYDKAIHSYLGSNTYITIGGGSGNGNFMFNNSEGNRSGVNAGIAQQINLGGQDIVFSYNELGTDFRNPNGGNSSNSIEVHAGTRFLIEYNSIYRAQPDACISIKENGTGNSEGIVRFNKFHDCGYGISVSSSTQYNHDIYVYGNFAYDMGGLHNNLGQMFRGLKYYDNIHFWSNIVSVHDSIALGAMGWRGRHQGDIYFYNNTIYKAGQDNSVAQANRAGFYANYANTPGLKVNFGNNIIMNTDVTNYYALYNLDVNDAQINFWEDNLLYYDGQAPKIYWKGSSWTLSQFQANTVWGDGTVVDNPDFTDADGTDNTDGTNDDNFTLTSVSPAVRSGTDLSSCFNVTVQGTRYNICYDDGLDPVKTDWSTTPPTVATLKRDTYGWSKGAYVYTGDAPRSIQSLSPPISLRISE